MNTAVGRNDCVPLVRPVVDPKFGDYQANGVMALAKQMKTDPRKLAEEIVKDLKVDDICLEPEIAGPGFINLRLNPDFIVRSLLEVNADSEGRLGIENTSKSQTVVVDFSSPNIAKQMHVGHLRSTILGDCICRLLEFLGHKVIRQNHIGDWGTQFGMLLALVDQKKKASSNSIESVHITDLEEFYRQAKQQFDSNSDFADESRSQVVKLQSHEKNAVKLWQHIVDESRNHYQPVYDVLDVNLHKENERGESFYADMLAGVVSDLKKLGLAVESDGAICVFPEGFKNKEGQPLPFIIQKSDGAFLYATTDLAALCYRIKELDADKIVYVTDARQKLHFEMLFTVAGKTGWTTDGIELVHVTFGSVLGEDGKPLKTRSGESVKLKELLNEAVERARTVVDKKNPDLTDEKKDSISRAVGIGAVKYADYSNNRTSDYIFSFDKMLALDGNTAPYMQYAYARIKSIERKAQTKDVDIETELSQLKELKYLDLSEPDELDLAKYLIRYTEAVQAAAADYKPNFLTAYLYELAQKFSTFYTNCPVLKAAPEKRPTRLLLCDLTAKTIQHGLSQLLGIKVVEQM
ncbi:MAG: arginine--tRNA ligase, partial [Planctomycetota bacterium]|jgi:arginyl-tRNA synthetase